MEFYSHDYLVHRASTLDWTQAILFALVALLLVFALVHYFRDRQNSKYRELALIALFSLIFLGLLQLDRVMEVDRGNKHYSAVVSSQESIARTMNVDTGKVYVALDEKGNQSYIEVDGKYYRILKNGERGYVLERVDLVGTDIRHVEE